MDEPPFPVESAFQEDGVQVRIPHRANSPAEHLGKVGAVARPWREDHLAVGQQEQEVLVHVLRILAMSFV